MPGRLIGVAGKKGHGKDTVARILCEQGFTLLRFADPLKAMLRAFYRNHHMLDTEIERRIEGDLKEIPCIFLRGKTPRHAMQTLGTEWGRGCVAGDLWVRSLIDRYYIGNEDVVVPDLRFVNEAHAIQDAGGRVIFVDASERVKDNEYSTHSSEQELGSLPRDTEINNNGTLFELKEAVRIALA